MTTTASTLITKQRLRDWGICASGYRWYLKNYKSDPVYQFVPMYQDLLLNGRSSDANWLKDKLFEEVSEPIQRVELLAQMTRAVADLMIEQAALKMHRSSTGYKSQAATTSNMSHATTVGPYSPAITSGNGSNATTADPASDATTTGFESHAATTGSESHATTTGNESHASTSSIGSDATTAGDTSHATTAGYESHAATTGNKSHAITAGNQSHATAAGSESNAATTGAQSDAKTSGRWAVSAALGHQGKAMAGEGGAIVIAWRNESGELLGVKAAMVGECGIKPNTWYGLDHDGNFIESQHH